MGTSANEVFVGGEPSAARTVCLRALEMAKFKNVVVSADGFSIRAEKQVGTQWTKTPLYVSLIPQQGGTLVRVSASSSAQSLASVIRSPANSVVRKFMDAMARV